jgi:hypothetical protein
MGRDRSKTTVELVTRAGYFDGAKLVSFVAMLAACAVARPPRLMAAPNARADAELPVAFNGADGPGVAQIMFHGDDGSRKRRFAPDEHITAIIELPRALDTIRELDDDPDLPLRLYLGLIERIGFGEKAGSHSHYVYCTLPRARLRHRARLVIASFTNPLVAPGPAQGDFTIGADGGDCGDPLRNALAAIHTIDASESGRVTAISEHFMLAYVRHDGSWVPLAAGRFDIDVADHVETERRYQALVAREARAANEAYELPSSLRPQAEESILAEMKHRYADPSYAPIRAVLLAKEWKRFTVGSSSGSVRAGPGGSLTVTSGSSGRARAFIDGIVVFRRDNGTCVARYYKFEAKPRMRLEDGEADELNATRVPERDRELRCQTTER